MGRKFGDIRGIITLTQRSSRVTFKVVKNFRLFGVNYVKGEVINLKDLNRYDIRGEIYNWMQVYKKGYIR
jgi:hypothetical protein